MIPLRTPPAVLGATPGLLCQGMPVSWHRPERYGIPTLLPDGMKGVVTAEEQRGESNVTYAFVTWGTLDSEWAPAVGLHIDWTARAAVFLCLAWLADRGHSPSWMLPSSHGGRVGAWSGLSAWEVSSVLASVSVLRVAAGWLPVPDLFGPYDNPQRANIAQDTHGQLIYQSAVRLGANGRALVVGSMHVSRHVYRIGWALCRSEESGIRLDTFASGPETGEAGMDAADAAALADGHALLVDGGVAVRVPGSP